MKRRVPAAVAPILAHVRRLGRRSSPICLSAFAFSLTHLAGPMAPSLQPPALPAAALTQQAVAAAPAPPLAAPAQSPAPSVEAAKPAEAPKPASPEVPKAAGTDAVKPAAVQPAAVPSPAPAAEAAKPEGPAPNANSAPAPATGHEQAPPAPVAATPAPAPKPAPVDNLERLRKAADLLAEANAAMGVPRSPYGQMIYEIAIRHSVNPQLVAALIHVESAFNSRAVSPKGAYGLMQLLPDTARRFGLTRKKDLFDPKKNLEAGVKYLKWLTTRFGGDVQKILAAYNAGEGAVERFGGIPPYRETQQYVKKIFGLLGFTADPPAAQAEPGDVVAAGR